MEVGEGLICIYHSVSPSTLNGGGGGAHLHLPQCVSLYLEWRWGRVHLHLPQCVSLYLEWRWGRVSFASFTMSLPLPGKEVGERLIHIVRVSPSTLGGGGGGAL